MFVPLVEMFNHQSLLESTFVYCTCIDIHTNPELCLLSDAVLWPGALFFTRGTQKMTQCPKVSNHLYMEHVSQDALVFAIYVPKVCNLQQIYQTKLRVFNLASGSMKLYLGIGVLQAT